MMLPVVGLLSVLMTSVAYTLAGSFGFKPTHLKSFRYGCRELYSINKQKHEEINTLQSVYAKMIDRGLVRECCKGDDASQLENGKFDHLPRSKPRLTNRHQKLRT